MEPFIKLQYSSSDGRGAKVMLHNTTTVGKVLLPDPLEGKLTEFIILFPRFTLDCFLYIIVADILRIIVLYRCTLSRHITQNEKNIRSKE